VRSVYFSPDKASSYTSKKKKSYGQHRLTLSVHAVCFSPDSKFLVAGAEDKTIKLWDIQV
jgi:WD40 repeat protein